MNKKNVILLGAVIIVFIGIILQNVIKPAGPLVLTRIDPETIDKITISNSLNQFTIVKEDSGWFIGDRKLIADATSVELLLNKIAKTKVLEKMTTAEERYNQYGLNTAEESIISLYTEDKEVQQFKVGQQDLSGKLSYVSVAGAKGVYLVSQNLWVEGGKELEAFREKDIFSLQIDAVEHIEVFQGDSYHLVKHAEQDQESSETVVIWKDILNEEVQLDQAKVNALAQTFGAVAANSFLESLSDSEIIWNVAVTEGNKKVSLTIYEQNEEGLYPCTSSESDYVFTLASYKAQSVMKKITDLLPEPVEQ